MLGRPKDAYPGSFDRIGRFKIGLIGVTVAGTSFDPMIFFGDTFEVKSNSGAPEEVLED